MAKTTRAKYKIIGWREMVALPELNIEKIKVKIDSGARTSALHAENIRLVKRKDGTTMVSFVVFPQQEKNFKVKAKAVLVDKRWVRSSTGAATLRPVISTMMRIGDEAWPIEITLINRDPMGFRMLIGRHALRGRFLIHPNRSFVLSPQPAESVT